MLPPPERGTVQQNERAGATTAGDPQDTRARLARELRRLLWLGVGWIPALLGSGVLWEAERLVPLAESANPYLVPSEAGLLYLWAPAVVLSATLLFLSPGLLLARLLGAAEELGRWLLYGLALALVLVSVGAALLQGLLGAPLVGGAFVVWVAGCSLAVWGFGALGVARGGPPPTDAFDGSDALRLLAPAIVVPWLLLAGLAPKFHWETFNGDGIHAFEAVRLLLTRTLPFWDPATEPLDSFPGVTTMLFTFPGAWYMRLFGAQEAAARVPLLLYLVGVYGGLIALVADRRRRVAAIDAWLIWGALSIYTLVLAFSASYDPYTADIALPATQDTLFVACLLGYLVAFVRGETRWMGLFLLLTYTSLPSGVLLVALWCGATVVTFRPWPWRAWLWTLGAGLACLAFGALLPLALGAFDLPLPGAEYAGDSLLDRFRRLRLTEVGRVLYPIVPCGIVPALALLAWRRLDAVSRALALTTLGYFGFFYIQESRVLVHHFVPAMLLPLAAFWRSDWVAADSPTRRPALWATGLGALLATALSLPESAKPLVHARRVGSALEIRVDGYDRSETAAFLPAPALGELFPTGMIGSVPISEYGGSPHIWNHYAHRRGWRPEPNNYVVQPVAAPPPDGMERVGERGGWAVYVRDPAVWEAHRKARLPFPPGSRIFQIERSSLF